MNAEPTYNVLLYSDYIYVTHIVNMAFLNFIIPVIQHAVLKHAFIITFQNLQQKNIYICKYMFNKKLKIIKIILAALFFDQKNYNKDLISTH